MEFPAIRTAGAFVGCEGRSSRGTINMERIGMITSKQKILVDTAALCCMAAGTSPKNCN